MSERVVEMIEALQSRWRMFADGSGNTSWADGITRCSEELAPILAAARAQEKELADLHVASDMVAMELAARQEELAAMKEQKDAIRSEARAGMREACAKAIEENTKGCPHKNLPCHCSDRMKVMDVSDLAADEAIERIKREARLEELEALRDLWLRIEGNSSATPLLIRIRDRIAALSGKETEHDS